MVIAFFYILKYFKIQENRGGNAWRIVHKWHKSSPQHHPCHLSVFLWQCPKYCIVFPKVTWKSLKAPSLCMVLVFVCFSFPWTQLRIENFLHVTAKRRKLTKEQLSDESKDKCKETQSKPSNGHGETDHLSEVSRNKTLNN